MNAKDLTEYIVEEFQEMEERVYPASMYENFIDSKIRREFGIHDFHFTFNDNLSLARLIYDEYKSNGGFNDKINELIEKEYNRRIQLVVNKRARITEEKRKRKFAMIEAEKKKSYADKHDEWQYEEWLSLYLCSF